MSDSTGGVGGAGAGGGANVHGNNDTHDTRGNDSAGSADASGASPAGAAQASAPAGGTAASTQASEDGARAHPEAHFSSEAPNPTGPTPGQIDSLTSANVATPMSAQAQAQMSAISQTTAAVQKAAESAAAIGFSPSLETAPAESSFSIANSPATADGRPKVDPKTSFGELGPAFSQTVDADKPSVTVTMTNPGMLAAGDGVTVSAVLHDASAPKKTGVPSLDVSATYNSTLATPVQDEAAKSVPAQVPGVQFGLGLTAVGTPNMAVNADAVLKGVGWSAEAKAGYDFHAKATSVDVKLSVKPMDVYAHQDWTANGASNTTVGVQYNFTDNFWAKAEVRNKDGVGSFYGGIGLKGKF